jgi:hypothetical protein
MKPIFSMGCVRDRPMRPKQRDQADVKAAF